MVINYEFLKKDGSNDNDESFEVDVVFCNCVNWLI